MRTIGQSVTALKTLVVLCLAFRFHHYAVGRRLQVCVSHISGKHIKQAVTRNTCKLFLMHVQQAGPSFPIFTLPSGIQNTLANLPQVMLAATSSRPHVIALQKLSGSLPAKHA